MRSFSAHMSFWVVLCWRCIGACSPIFERNMTSLDGEGVRTIDKFQWRELQYLKIQIGDGVGFCGPLEHCG